MLYRLTSGGFVLRLEAGLIGHAADIGISVAVHAQPLWPALTDR